MLWTKSRPRPEGPLANTDNESQNHSRQMFLQCETTKSDATKEQPFCRLKIAGNDLHMNVSKIYGI